MRHYTPLIFTGDRSRPFHMLVHFAAGFKTRSIMLKIHVRNGRYSLRGSDNRAHIATLEMSGKNTVLLPLEVVANSREGKEYLDKLYKVCIRYLLT